MSIVRWVEEGGVLTAYHPECTSEQGIEVGLDTEPQDGYEPIFCCACRLEMGFYDPMVEPDVILRLQREVEEAHRNCLENGYEEDLEGDLTSIAREMLEKVWGVEMLVKEEGLSKKHVVTALTQLRRKLCEHGVPVGYLCLCCDGPAREKPIQTR